MHSTETPAGKAKQRGIPCLKIVTERTGVSSQTLGNWSRNKPELFSTVLDGVAAQLKEERNI